MSTSLHIFYLIIFYNQNIRQQIARVTDITIKKQEKQADKLR